MIKARRHGWTRNQAPSKTAAVYTHVSGWQVRHCGHMSAIWPFLAISPKGRSFVSPCGRGFVKLIDAQVAVERTVNGEELKLVCIDGRHVTGAGTGMLQRGRRNKRKPAQASGTRLVKVIGLSTGFNYPMRAISIYERDQKGLPL